MLRIDCPFCGLRNHDEFTYLEDGSVSLPPLDNTDTKQWFDAVFLRENPKGIHTEDWHHTTGCRMVVRVKRDTLSHQIISTAPAHPAYGHSLRDTAGKAMKKKMTRSGK